MQRLTTEDFTRHFPGPMKMEDLFNEIGWGDCREPGWLFLGGPLPGQPAGVELVARKRTVHSGETGEAYTVLDHRKSRQKTDVRRVKLKPEVRNKVAPHCCNGTVTHLAVKHWPDDRWMLFAGDELFSLTPICELDLGGELWPAR